MPGCKPEIKKKNKHFWILWCALKTLAFNHMQKNMVTGKMPISQNSRNLILRKYLK